MKYIRLSLCFALLAVATVFFSLTAAADTGGVPGMIFVCEQPDSGDKLTVTAYLENPDTQINAGMFVLNYDGQALSVSDGCVSPCDGISILEYNDADRHCVGADWFPSASVEPSEVRTPIAVISFNVSEKGRAKLNRVLSVCNDAEYLDSIGGYGGDEGVLLCTDSTHTYSSGENTAHVSFEPEHYYGKKSGNSGLKAALIAVSIVTACAAAYLYIRKGKARRGTLSR